jgi:hypothetical protein
VPPADVRVEVLEQPDARVPARVGARVAGQLDEVEAVQQRQSAGQVGEEDEAGLQRADEQRLATLVVGRDLVPELRDPRTDLARGQVDVADAGLGGDYDARSSR